MTSTTYVRNFMNRNFDVKMPYIARYCFWRDNPTGPLI
jgi:hypothetical protein